MELKGKITKNDWKLLMSLTPGSYIGNADVMA